MRKAGYLKLCFFILFENKTRGVNFKDISLMTFSKYYNRFISILYHSGYNIDIMGESVTLKWWFRGSCWIS